MRLLTFILIITSIFLISCKGDKTTLVTQLNATNSSPLLTTPIPDHDAYTLMKQKCLICHFEKPDPARHDQMIAPPMMRVQEHYKPTFPDKEAFINAVTEWVKNPIEAETLMPGAVRKFNVMPKLVYEDKDVRAIADYLFDMDFEDMPKMGMGHGNKLLFNKGKKWSIKATHIDQIKSIQQKVKQFESDDIVAYNQLGKDVFQEAKHVLLDDSYPIELFDQLHVFFNGLEQNMHVLIAAKDLSDAKNQQQLINKKFVTFFEYFE